MATSRSPTSSKSSTRRCPRMPRKSAPRKRLKRSPPTSTKPFTPPKPEPGNRPPVIEPARLTVRQYRKSSPTCWHLLRRADDRRRARPQGRLLQSAQHRAATKRSSTASTPRSSSTSPTAARRQEKIKPEEFSIRWEGSLIVEETGDYEFSIKSENGVRLWVNNPDKAADRRMG